MLKSLNILSNGPAVLDAPPELPEGVAFSVTESAAQQVHELLAREKATKPEVQLLRVGVRGGGCSGLSYVMEFVADSEPKDTVFEYYGVRICVDPKSLRVLQGTTLDYGRGIQRAGFQWLNPNQKKACGCGESFAV